MHEECLICKAALEYLDADERMTCERCHKQFQSKTRCINGHFICDVCHTTAGDDIRSICLRSLSKNPIEIMEEMMSMPSCHMHGPEHHIMVGSALLTAYKNAGGAIDLEAALEEMQKRGQQVPGGACGFWGACGAGISAGMFLAIALKSTPLAKAEWGYANQMTARALQAIGEQGGPRCCKRNAYLAIGTAVQFVREKLGLEMSMGPITCTRSHLNNQCKQAACAFYPKAKKKVAFICVHNACRSQIAEALGKALASDVFEAYSAGTALKTQINPDAARIMKAAYGIDMTQTQHPKTIADIPSPDLVISMGCKVQCPFIGRAFDANWALEDPTGQSDEAFHAVIETIKEKILALKAALS